MLADGVEDKGWSVLYMLDGDIVAQENHFMVLRIDNVEIPRWLEVVENVADYAIVAKGVADSGG